MKRNAFKEYVEYLRDNPEGYWFKQKAFGFGWVPVTREGWLVTIVIILLIIGNAVRLDPQIQADPSVVKTLFLQTGALIILLIIICFKTGEKPRWHWTFPKNTDHEKRE